MALICSIAINCNLYALLHVKLHPLFVNESAGNANNKDKYYQCASFNQNFAPDMQTNEKFSQS
jgi:hypothetical protein